MFKDKVKTSVEKAKKHAYKLKKEVAALSIACKRKDVPWYVKIIITLVVGYAFSPIDLIPDFIPIVGYLDDLIIVPLGIWLAINLLPKDILDECKIQANEDLKSGKEKNWFAGIFIIVIWILITVWILFK